MLEAPLPLPCGAALPNRLAKAAMTEGLADAKNFATAAHVRLYELWAKGGAGLLITGNVQVDRRHLERPGNIAIEPGATLEERKLLERVAEAGRAGGGALWMQLSHAGRQTPRAVNAAPAAASPIPLTIPGKNFGKPRALRASEIEEVKQRFVFAALVARECGFSGVQIHSAHGYLLSDLLSPRANQRTDEWGGSLENRARLLLSIVRELRSQLGPSFPISVKLNSSDFRRGGFGLEDCAIVGGWLVDAGVDLLEVTGGTYEQPMMMGLGGALEPKEDPLADEARDREGYFMAHFLALRESFRLPLMVTGGFRTRHGMMNARKDGVDVIGLARPLCTEPALPARLLRGEIDDLPQWEASLQLGPGWLGRGSPFPLVRTINGFGLVGWYYEQLKRMGQGQAPDTDLPLWRAFWKWQTGENAAARALELRS